MKHKKSALLYLDHAATTPVDPRVLAAMEPFFAVQYGNPSSLHAFGVAAKKAIEESKLLIASFLKAQPNEIFFTSGGTESNNLALLGYARANKEKGLPSGRQGRHIIVSAMEHHSVLHAARALVHEGFEITELPVNTEGLVEPGALGAALRDDTILISIQYANNEIGTVQPIKELAALARKRGIFFHTDAVQAAGALSLDASKLGVSAMSLSASKMYGPKGVGMLWVRKGEKLQPLMHGGGQQAGVRPGTENVPGIVGFARALEIAQTGKEGESIRLSTIRDELFDELQEAFPGMLVNGSRAHRLPNNINVTIPGADGEAMVIYASQEGLMLSTGSACSTVDPDPSHVLRAIGRTEEEANASIRITLGRTSRQEDVQRIVQTLQRIFEKVQ